MHLSSPMAVKLVRGLTKPSVVTKAQFENRPPSMRATHRTVPPPGGGWGPREKRPASEGTAGQCPGISLGTGPHTRPRGAGPARGTGTCQLPARDTGFGEESAGRGGQERTGTNPARLPSTYGATGHLAPGRRPGLPAGLRASPARARASCGAAQTPRRPTAQGPPRGTSHRAGAWRPRPPTGSPRPGLRERANPGPPSTGSRAGPGHRGPRPPRGRAYPSGEYSRLKTAPWVRVLRYTESAGWMEP